MSICFAGLSNAGNAAGTALGIAVPCLGIVLWFAVSHTYRKEKKLLVASVLEHLKASDVTTTDSLPAKGLAPGTQHCEHADSARELTVPAIRVSGMICSSPGQILETPPLSPCLHSHRPVPPLAHTLFLVYHLFLTPVRRLSCCALCRVLLQHLPALVFSSPETVNSPVLPTYTACCSATVQQDSMSVTCVCLKQHFSNGKSQAIKQLLLLYDSSLPVLAQIVSLAWMGSSCDSLCSLLFLCRSSSNTVNAASSKTDDTAVPQTMGLVFSSEVRSYY